MFKNAIDFSFLLFFVSGTFAIFCKFLGYTSPAIIVLALSITTWICVSFVVFGTFAVLLYINTFDSAKKISTMIDVPLERVTKTVNTNLTASVWVGLILLATSSPILAIVSLLTAGSYWLVNEKFFKVHNK